MEEAIQNRSKEAYYKSLFIWNTMSYFSTSDAKVDDHIAKAKNVAAGVIFDDSVLYPAWLHSYGRVLGGARMSFSSVFPVIRTNKNPTLIRSSEDSSSIFKGPYGRTSRSNPACSA